MYPNAFRRVFKSLSPRKHDASNPTSPNNSTDNNDLSNAAAEQYTRFLARVSVRADANPSDANIPDPEPDQHQPETGHECLDLLLDNQQHTHHSGDWSNENSPPGTPPDARILSRLHRRAVRGVSPLVFTDKENDPSNSSPVTPVHSDESERPSPHQLPQDQLQLDTENHDYIVDQQRQHHAEGTDQDDIIYQAQEENSNNVPIHAGVDPALHFTDFVAVGCGGSGSVFFATHTATTTRVALKRVTPHTPPKLAALETEIRTLHALRHPNIVRGFGAYSHEQHVWIVMEAMDIGSLTSVLDFLRARRFLLSEAHVAYIIREALQGLWAMHSRKCMHRDVKSDNVLVCSDGNVKLGDFEYSAVLTEGRPKRRTVVGTAWWMSPETVRQSYYDYAADVWSVGILAIECAEWVPPLFGMESKQAMEVIKKGVTHQGFRRPDMWSVEFADFVRGCLTRDRDLRYTVPQLLAHPFLEKACSKQQIANVFRAIKGLPPL